MRIFDIFYGETRDGTKGGFCNSLGRWSKTVNGAALKLFQHTHLPSQIFFLQLSGVLN